MRCTGNESTQSIVVSGCMQEGRGVRGRVRVRLRVRVGVGVRVGVRVRWLRSYRSFSIIVL